MKMNLRSAPERGFNFDYIMWLFTRLSALGMYLLVIAGLAGALVMGARTQVNMADVLRWGFMPNPNHVLLDPSNNILIPDAWMTIFWKLMGCAILLLAGAHGFHGLLNVIEDYLSSARVRQFLRILVLIIMVIMLVIGIYVIWTS
jgi:succinate dehydrogenase hydrophobic anchor subunit